MLSIETEARVAKLFLTLAEGEKAVEINRQVLADQLDFDPNQVFKRLDTRGKNIIDEFDIVDFLKVNSVYCTYNEARFIIFFYDRDNDGTLDYSEFLNLVLSEVNYTLRRIARERVGYQYNRLTLPYDVEYSLSKLFERELDLVRNLELVLNDVKARYDFNVYELFSSIQSYSNLTSENIRTFLFRNGAEASDSDVHAILKRLDIDGDSRVSFTEFKKLFVYPSATVNLKDSYNMKSSTVSRSPLYETKKTTFDSPLRRTASPRRYYSPNRTVRISSPMRSTYTNPIVSRSPLKTSMRSPVRTVRSPLRSQVLNKSVESFGRSRVPNLTTTVPNFKYSYNLLSYEEENFINYVKDVISIENEIERSKCDLVLRSDFNIEDAFRIFELDGRGYLTELDFKYGLNALDIFPTVEEISLLIKRFDNQNEGIISYANFFEIVAPLDREYRRMLENRLPSSSYVRFNKPDIFLPTTKLYFQNLLNLVLRSEARVEGWRQRLNKMPRFNARLIYEKIDRIDKNYFNETDIVDYFNRSDISYLNKDVDLLLYRLDRDRDGRVSYLEFSDELYPKSTQFFSL